MKNDYLKSHLGGARPNVSDRKAEELKIKRENSKLSSKPSNLPRPTFNGRGN